MKVALLSDQFKINLDQNALELLSNTKPFKVVSISTTSNQNNPDAYFASFRESVHSVTLPVIINNEAFIDPVIDAFDGKVDFFLLDTEKKNDIEGLCGICEAKISKSGILYYKPNDLTVETVKDYCLQHGILNKQIVICGLGNIGFKLALILCELPNKIFLKSRDKEKARLAAKMINMVAKSATAVEVHDEKTWGHDVLMGTSSGVPVIGLADVECMADHGIILDVGNGTVCPDAVAQALNSGKKVFCINILQAYNNFIDFTLNQYNAPVIPGEATLSGYRFIRVGMVGMKGDILVDNPDCIRKIFGICNGRGDLLYGQEIDEQIKKIKRVVGIG